MDDPDSPKHTLCDICFKTLEQRSSRNSKPRQLSRTCSKLSFITTQKALIFNQFYSTFLEMASSILMVINGSSKDKLRATNSIPSLSANLSKPSSKLNSRIALFISSQRPPLTKPFLIFKICCNGSRLLTFARLLSGTILNTCRHLCHKQSSQELLMMLSRQAPNDSVSLYVYSGKSKGFSILVLRNVSKLQSVKYGNLLKT